MRNTDHGPVIYRFTLGQIAQAAQDIADARKFILPETQSLHGTFTYPGRDIVGAISQVVGPGHYGTFDSRAVIAESIIMHYLGMHPYAWEDQLYARFPHPSPIGYDMNTAAGLFAYQQAGKRVPVRRAEQTVVILDLIVEWLNSDRFTGGTRGPAADSEAQASEGDRARAGSSR